jgi:hypothetical protein
MSRAVWRGEGSRYGAENPFSIGCQLLHPRRGRSAGVNRERTRRHTIDESCDRRPNRLEVRARIRAGVEDKGDRVRGRRDGDHVAGRVHVLDREVFGLNADHWLVRLIDRTDQQEAKFGWRPRACVNAEDGSRQTDREQR